METLLHENNIYTFFFFNHSPSLGEEKNPEKNGLIFEGWFHRWISDLNKKFRYTDSIKISYRSSETKRKLKKIPFNHKKKADEAIILSDKNVLRQESLLEVKRSISL